MEVAVVGPAAEPAALVVPLDRAASLGLGADRIGSKAANLAQLLAAGFPIPAGVVIPTDAFADWPQLQAVLPAAASTLGEGPLAVRSSAAAEDLAGASYAGLYETFLDVDREHLAEAVRRCWESATSQRVTAYQHHHQRAPARPAQDRGRPAMAVLVQRMIHPDAAGVAFTANPVSGARDEVVVTAVRGLGERLVAGEATGDQWIIRDGQASRTREAEQAIDADQARAVAALARRVEQHFAAPQDLEWAITDNRLWLLQARPMTALPEPVTWTPPARGYWMRNFRLGEWLPEPMTPLFASWLLERLEQGYLQATRQHTGARLVFPHVAINGWYYTATPRPSPSTILAALVSGRGRLVRFMRHAVLGPGRDPISADRRLLHRLAEEWRQELLPRYQQAVQAGEQQVETADPKELAGLVDPVGVLAGEYLCRCRWWAGRPGRWKAPWPASTVSTWPPPSAVASSSCWSAYPAPNQTCHPMRSRVSIGPTPLPVSSAGSHPSPPVGTATWPPNANS